MRPDLEAGANYPTHLTCYQDMSARPWFIKCSGLTGQVLMVVILVLVTAAPEMMRRRAFNSFWFSHHLFVIYYALLIFHGPVFWKWLLVPGGLYFLERLLRKLRGANDHEVLR